MTAASDAQAKLVTEKLAERRISETNIQYKLQCIVMFINKISKDSARKGNSHSH